MTARPYEFTDDPNAPCMYCARWTCPICGDDCDEQGLGTEHDPVPMMPHRNGDGSWGEHRVAAVLRTPHDRCLQMVAEYESESRTLEPWA